MTETLFKEVKYDLDSLIKYIDIGEIGLPDIQRPFVWKNAKVRDLFDSMYRGFPVGYLLFWQNGLTDSARGIGQSEKQKAPHLLIVDGQQRLTSLYAVLKGVPVVRENYETEHIEIAFNPIQRKFEVADAAIRRDKTFIPDISRIWNRETDIFELVEAYLEGLASTREVTPAETRAIRKSITNLYGLQHFPFTALELSSNVDEEQVAEVFVRINSMGKVLNQADFILTLMSVFWDDGRKDLEEFCRAARKPTKGTTSPFNYFIEPDPDQLLRVSVAIGFKRARLKFVYNILRGKDLETEEFSDERRERQFQVLKEAQSRVLDIQYWHDFLKCLVEAGYKSTKMISSENNLIFSYVLYLLGRTEYGIKDAELRPEIARWFFMTALTRRYTGSPESAMEFDLARFRGITDGDQFLSILRQICDATLTSDFWSITLPTELATSAATSPSLYAFYASQVRLGAKALFSSQTVSALLDPGTTAIKAPLEKHHLFPTAYLKSIGISSVRETNQLANYALVEWGDNVAISDKPPAEYMPVFRERLPREELERMHYWHALPDGWENMDYHEFLKRRRELMAGVVRDAYKAFSGESNAAEQVPLDTLVEKGEGKDVEFKSTLRVNLHTGEPDKRMEFAVLRTIAGFLNMEGGTLVIGVADDGTAVGIEVDGFENEDKMLLHLDNLINSRIGAQYAMYIHAHFEEYDGKRALLVDCWKSRSPAYVKDGAVEKFFVRTGASTAELTASEMNQYIAERF